MEAKNLTGEQIAEMILKEYDKFLVAQNNLRVLQAELERRKAEDEKPAAA